MKIAILTSVFTPEYGVARVVASQLPFFVAAGVDVDVYACEVDRKLLYPGVNAVRVPTHLKGLRRALIRGHYDVVIAHTDPFFKFLAENDVEAVKVGYEHGYPPVELCLPEEQEKRREEIGDRLGKIYPNLDCLVTISNFAVEYLQWPEARVIYNGADHYNDGRECVNCGGDGPITILAVSRFRKEEWRYKGVDCLCRLKQDLGDSVNVMLVGRGDSESTEKLLQSGVQVVGMVSEERLGELYRSCDVLVSFSQWELFNLPLAEAGFAHKPALAFRQGPHPEVSPFTFDSYEQICDFLRNSTRQSLREDGERMYAHVDARFRWKNNSEKLLALLHELCPHEKNIPSSFLLKWDWAKWNFREFLRQKIYKRLKRH